MTQTETSDFNLSLFSSARHNFSYIDSVAPGYNLLHQSSTSCFHGAMSFAISQHAPEIHRNITIKLVEAMPI